MFLINLEDKGILRIRRIVIFFLCFLFIPLAAKAADNSQLKKDLENQIDQLQDQINHYQVDIKNHQDEARTLESEISILENQIKAVKLEIKQIDLSIQECELNIQEMEDKIIELEEQIERKKIILAEYIRVVEEYDRDTLLEIILEKDSFSDFFDEINALESTQKGIQSVLTNIRELRTSSIEHKENKESELEEKSYLRSLQQIQKKTITQKQYQKEDLLEETKGKEMAFQEMVKNNQESIAHIREQLSLLEKYDITLEDAVQNAILVGSKTGLRPAYLLGVLEAESRLGLNVGTGNWKDDMYDCYRELGYVTKAEQMKNAFLEICQGLGLNPDNQPVSAEPWYGCGGAMGVAQFMPTTWMAYKDRVAAMTGHNPPNPWNHLDAFMAAGIKLSDGGANQRTEAGERKAYAIYLGGSNWRKWVNHKVTDYVINLAADFQKEYFE